MKIKAMALALPLASISLYALADYEGGIPVRIPGTNQICINTNEHKISLHLRRFLVGKDENWFSQDRQVGLLLETAISSENWETGETKKQAFPKLFKSDVSRYKRGIVSIPVEEKLFHNFDLKKGTTNYDSVEISFTILKKKKKANFGIALEKLDEISKSIPASIDPFSTSFKFFADYANSVVSESLTEQNNVDSSLSDAKLVLSFSSDEKCEQDEQKTGIIAVIKSNADRIENTIDIAKINKYCIEATYTPSFSIQYSNKNDDGTCPTNLSSFNELQNPYTLFVLNASKTNQKDGVAGAEINNEMIQGNKERCELLSIDLKDCY